MAGGLEGRTAWVTGGSSGIGRATVDALRRAGAQVASIDVSTPDDDLPWISCDIGRPDAVSAAMPLLAARTGWPDVLVNNAGTTATGLIPSLSDGDWDRALAVNLSGAFYLLRAVMPGMLERGWGRIVSISSGTAVRVHPGRAAYAASKAGLIALTKVAALEGAGRGVTANVVAPGITDTPMTRASIGSRESLESNARESAIANPMGVVLDPEDIAAAVLQFCLPASRYVTGQVLHVSAGSVMP